MAYRLHKGLKGDVLIALFDRQGLTEEELWTEITNPWGHTCTRAQFDAAVAELREARKIETSTVNGKLVFVPDIPSVSQD